MLWAASFRIPRSQRLPGSALKCSCHCMASANGGTSDGNVKQPDREILLVVSREPPVDGRNAPGPDDTRKDRGEVHGDDLDAALIAELVDEPLIDGGGACRAEPGRDVSETQVLAHGNAAVRGNHGVLTPGDARELVLEQHFVGVCVAADIARA